MQLAVEALRGGGAFQIRLASRGRGVLGGG
jgi:hypothetical protein